MKTSEQPLCINVVGCGGIGGWVAQALGKMLEKDDTMRLIDGDKVEARNLDRQLLNHVGMYKVKSLLLGVKPKCKVELINKYLTDTMDIDGTMICCVDNHPARLACLNMVDAKSSEVIIAANEYIDAEAYYYTHKWRGTRLDPRTYSPELLTDNTGDPTAPCTGHAMEINPQLAIANMRAASLAMWMFWFYAVEAKKLTIPEAIDSSPVIVRSTFNSITVKTKGEM